MQPISWTRPKLNGQQFFDGQIKAKVCFGLALQSQHNTDLLYSKPIAFNVTFYMKAPLKPKPNLFYHSCAPDLDNLLKFVFDAIKDVLITDDRIICSITAKKIYAKEARTEFTITEV
jgi:Holliday junction resolvase RusA-like endonuclease